MDDPDAPPQYNYDLSGQQSSALADWYAEFGNRLSQAAMDPELGAKMALGFVGGKSPVNIGENPLLTQSVMASRSARLYPPPAIAPRSFGADYPAGAQADATGRLVADIEGRPLTAPYVAGRQVLGGGDSPIAPDGVLSVAEGATRSSPQAVATSAMPGKSGSKPVGTYERTVNPSTGEIEHNIYVDKSLSPGARQPVLAHEVGHAIDEISGQIPTKGITDQLRSVYNTMNNPNQGYQTKLFGPENNKYKGADVPRELMAEAIRGYMANPGWLKSVAPEAAASIREAVNAHPVLSKVIQFNSAAGMVGSGFNALQSQGDDQ